MSAAMINVGLTREFQFPIRNATAHAYACVTVVATGLPSSERRPASLSPSSLKVADTTIEVAIIDQYGR